MDVYSKSISSVIILIIILTMLLPCVRSDMRKEKNAFIIKENYYAVSKGHKFLNVRRNELTKKFVVNINEFATYYLCSIQHIKKEGFFIFDMQTERFICVNGAHTKTMAMRLPTERCRFVEQPIQNSAYTKLHNPLTRYNISFRRHHRGDAFLINVRNDGQSNCTNHLQTYCRKFTEHKHLHGRRPQSFCRQFLNLKNS